MGTGVNLLMSNTAEITEMGDSNRKCPNADIPQRAHSMQRALTSQR